MVVLPRHLFQVVVLLVEEEEAVLGALEQSQMNWRVKLMTC